MSILPHSPIDSLTLDDVLTRLDGVKKTGSGHTARCPAHDDEKASLSIGSGNDGRILLTCHAGCSFDSICDAIGAHPSELFPGSAPTPRRVPTRKAPSFQSIHEAIGASTRSLVANGGKLAGQWQYHDENGAIVGVAVRVDMPDGGKEIRPLALVDGAWSCKAMPAPRPVYRLRELMNAESRELLVITEGEKCADAVASIGLVATTSAGGANAARQSDWKIAVSFNEIWVLADNDPAGLKYANDVEASIRRHDPGAAVKVFTLPGVGVGGDVVDWLGQQGDASEPAGIRNELRRLADASSVAPAEDEPAGWVPFPVDVLPMVARKFVEESAASIGCDASFLTLPLLTMAGGALGANRWLETKVGWRVAPILWSAIVGRSGSNKSPALNAISGLLAPVMRRWRDEYAAALVEHDAAGLTYEKRLKEWSRKKESNDVPAPRPAAPSMRRLVVADTTIEQLATILDENQRGLVLVRDELDGWLQSFQRYSGSSDAPFWLHCYSGSPYSVDRRSRGVPAFLDCPLVAVCGGIQPKILKRRMAGEHEDSGLLARFIVTCPPPMLRRWRNEVVQASTREAMAGVMLRLVEAEESTLVLSPEAEKLFAAWVDANGLVVANATDAEAACLTKIEELPARLAIILHSLDGAAGAMVSGATMEGAVRLAEWFRHEKLRWHQSDAEPARDENERLVALLRKAGEAGLTARDASRRCSWLRKSGAAEKALEQLQRDGVAMTEIINPPHGGRPRVVYRLKSV